LSAEHVTPGLQPGIPTAPPAPHAPSVSESFATPLAHHFRDLGQQHEAGTLGMWLFLATEVLFFGGVLTAFEIYHFLFPQAFEAGSRKLITSIGAVNTLVLLCSSLTMALAVRAAQAGQGRRMLQAFLAATMALGLAFLVLKGVEYYIDYREHLVPNLDFQPKQWPEGVDVRHGEIFFGFYFVLTGIHATHMIVGLALMVVVFLLARRGRYTPDNYTAVDCLGLYWHFVDIVWVFLLPLLYLIR
jgi:cytochrome c oxidase subunit 3